MSDKGAQTELLLTGMLTREERILHERRFRMIPDKSDISHAISAYLPHCQYLVTYDAHFDAVNEIIPVTTPEQLLAKND